MSDPTNRTIAEMLADLDASEAELAVGDVVPGETILANIQAAIDRLEAKRATDQHRKVAPGR